ncbi:MAG: four helix bundle protein [Bdellovibrionota bacterium]
MWAYRCLLPSSTQCLNLLSRVVLNLAEGSAKPTQRDKARFYAIAFGSIREIQAIFNLIEIKDKETLDLADHIAACVYKLSYPKKP